MSIDITPVHQQITQARERETLEAIEAEIHAAGTDGITTTRVVNRAAHYMSLPQGETQALIDQLVSTGRVEKVRETLRSTANGWTLRSQILTALRQPTALTAEDLIEGGIEADPRSIRRTLRELAADGLVNVTQGGKRTRSGVEPVATIQSPETVSGAVLARAMGLDPSTPVGRLLEAVREMSQGYSVISSTPDVDALAEALDCRPAGSAIMLAVAQDRAARAHGHNILLRETQAAIEGCGLSPDDDHPAQVINQLAARLRQIKSLADTGTVVDGGE